VPAAQTLLFPDPRPLVERLGRDFFQSLPQHPGVYLMRDAGDAVLYVGKAKNLRKRLASYRVANPDRMPRRHLRLLRTVARIELETCADESAALVRESELLRSLKPKFNRAGTWPGTPRFLVWQQDGESMEFGVTETPQPAWHQLGPMSGAALYLRCAVVRLLWCASYPDLSMSRMPSGWSRGALPNPVRLCCGGLAGEAALFLERLLAGQVDEFSDWLSARRAHNSAPFEKTALAEEMDALKKLLPGAVSTLAKLATLTAQ